MIKLSKKFKIGRFGQDSVDEAKWRDTEQRVMPVFLEEDDIISIQMALLTLEEYEKGEQWLIIPKLP